MAEAPVPGRQPSRILSLTADFGLQDEYVGAMKGVVLGRAPNVRIGEVTHAVAAQDVRGAAWC